MPHHGSANPHRFSGSKTAISQCSHNPTFIPYLLSPSILVSSPKLSTQRRKTALGGLALHTKSQSRLRALSNDHHRRMWDYTVIGLLACHLRLFQVELTSFSSVDKYWNFLNSHYIPGQHFILPARKKKKKWTWSTEVLILLKGRRSLMRNGSWYDRCPRKEISGNKTI